MNYYRIIPHVADVRLRIEGDTLSELFLAGLEGMSQIIKQDFCANNKTFLLERNISIVASDTTSLLVDFLSEALTYSYVERAIFCEAVFDKLTPIGLKAVIFGKKVNYFNEDIKAVTYHEANIVKNKKGNLETVIVFDI